METGCTSFRLPCKIALEEKRYDWASYNEHMEQGMRAGAEGFLKTWLGAAISWSCAASSGWAAPAVSSVLWTAKLKLKVAGATALEGLAPEMPGCTVRTVYNIKGP